MGRIQGRRERLTVDNSNLTRVRSGLLPVCGRATRIDRLHQRLPECLSLSPIFAQSVISSYGGLPAELQPCPDRLKYEFGKIGKIGAHAVAGTMSSA